MRISASTILVLCILTACSDGGGGTTEPPPPPSPFELAVTSPGTITATRSTDDRGLPVVRCDYQITATATGGGAGAAATWDGARLEWQRHRVDAVPAVTEHSAAEVSSWFAVDRVRSGTSATASRAAWWNAPFNLTTTIRYRTATGELRTSVAYLTCQ